MPVADARGEAWRTYVVRDVAELDADDVARVVVQPDAAGEASLVIAELAPTAASRYGELARRAVGHELAVVFGDEVQSAPVLAAPIDSGQVAITAHGDRERDVLVGVLRAGALPLGGRVESVTYVPPDAATRSAWLARLALALCVGVAVGTATLMAKRRLTSS